MSTLDAVNPVSLAMPVPNDASGAVASVVHHKSDQYPPLHLWQIALMIFVTGGLYGAFWCYRTARNFQREEPEIRSYLYFFGSLLGIPFPFIIWRFLGHCEDRLEDHGRTLRTSNAVIILLACMYLVFGLISDSAQKLFDNTAIAITVSCGAFFIMLVFLTWATWCVQRELNDDAVAHANAYAWKSTPFQFNYKHIIGMIFGASVWIAVIVALLMSTGWIFNSGAEMQQQEATDQSNSMTLSAVVASLINGADPEEKEWSQQTERLKTGYDTGGFHIYEPEHTSISFKHPNRSGWLIDPKPGEAEIVINGPGETTRLTLFQYTDSDISLFDKVLQREGSLLDDRFMQITREETVTLHEVHMVPASTATYRERSEETGARCFVRTMVVDTDLYEFIGCTAAPKLHDTVKTIVSSLVVTGQK